MQDLLRDARRRFLSDVADGVGRFDGRIVLVTHVLPDRPELLAALARIAPVALVIAIPYSTDGETLHALRSNHAIVTPTLAELLDPEWITETAVRAADGAELVVSEIGGYFAPALGRLKDRLGGRLRGVVEDTDAGHRRYEEAGELPCPVVSVARSSLKQAEDVLVGPSCLFSVDRLLRQVGFLLRTRHALVLGYGRVGQGVARALESHRCPVAVHDVDPVRRALALAEGYAVPDRASALAGADIIFGATGRRSLTAEDLPRLRPGAVLVSCSSKEVEFDLKGLAAGYSRVSIVDGLEEFRRDRQTLYLVARGRPVNFLDGAVLGPVLALVQAETLVAVGEVLQAPAVPGLRSVTEGARRRLAEAWLGVFCDPPSGFYRQV